MDLQQIERNLKRHVKRNWSNLDFDFEIDSDGFFTAFASDVNLSRNNNDYPFSMCLVIHEEGQFASFFLNFQGELNKDMYVLERINDFNDESSTLSAAICERDDGSHYLRLNYSFHIMDKDDLPIEILFDTFVNDMFLDDDKLDEIEPLLELLY